MSLLQLWRWFWRTRRTPPASEPDLPIQRHIDLRIAAVLFDEIRAHVENFTRGEEAGFLLCGLSRLADRDVLLAREWLRVPDEAITRDAHGSVLSWSAEFNSKVLARAVELGCAPVLVHSHGSRRPE